MSATPLRAVEPQPGAPPAAALAEVEVTPWGAAGRGVRPDQVVVEEPLEIRLGRLGEEPKAAQSITITMRTPGHDFELAAGFLLGEGVVGAASDIAGIVRCGPPMPDGRDSNVVRVDLAPGVAVDRRRLERNFVSTSSCGVCGKASLEALALTGPAVACRGMRVPAEAIAGLPAQLRADQPIFEHTGGVHAAGLFDGRGRVGDVAEDVGRHNAVDKLLGRGLLRGDLPLRADSEAGLVVSGRTSFEILQKAVAARLPLVVAVGAPSSLAIELAGRFGVTLVGFARAGGFNIYTHPERIA